MASIASHAACCAVFPLHNPTGAIVTGSGFFPANGDVFDVAECFADSILVSLEEAGLEEAFDAGCDATAWANDYYEDDENGFMYFA